MARLLTQSQFARKSGYTRARISQLVKTGIIQLKKGKIDASQANAAIEANIDRSRRIKAETKSKTILSPQLELIPRTFNSEQKNTNGSSRFNTDQQNDYPSTIPSLTEARRDHEIMKMKLTEYQLKTKRGQLVQKDEATKMVVALGTAIKLAFQNLPRRLAPALKAITDEREIEIILRSEIKNIIRILEQAHHAKPKHSGSKNSKRGLGKHLEAPGGNLPPGLG